MARRWTPGFLSKLFFGGTWILEVTPEGLQIDGRSYGWSSLTRCEAAPAFFWGHLRVAQGEQDLVLRGMPRRLVSEIAACSQTLGAMLPAIRALRAAMASDLYVANKRVREALGAAGAHTAGWDLDDSNLIAPDLEPLRPDLTLFKQVASGDYRAIEARNDQFVAQEMVAHDEYFRSVESSVLTSEQRVATVVMEDCNLVIAAAGSGKTSVLVAKVGYLVKKGYALPEEILVLSFNKSVADEIGTRIKERLVQPGVISAPPEVSTFHAFGMATIKETGPTPKLAQSALSSDLRSRELMKIFFDLIESDPQFQADAIRFLALHGISGTTDEANALAAQLGKSWRELITQPVGTVELPDPGSYLYITLSGDTVRSKQELQIANWLTAMGIEFVYEEPFPPVESHPWTRSYQPDFYYPALDLWHEHFGINIFGEAPTHWGVNRQGMTYEEQAASKRRMLTEVKARWFETTSGDFETGVWEEKLRSNLEKAGAKPQLISWERLQELATSAGFKQAPALDLLGAAIAHFKSNHLSIEELRAKAQASADSDRSRDFVRLFEKVFARYEALLAQASQIDFDDMLRISAQRLREQPVQGRLKAILIDEFQDMSNARAELVKAVLHQNPQATLFAVGDDWQSIYRFAGSDIRVMTQFQKLFGFTRQVTLATTFRCNQGLANLSSEFIRKNPTQISKSVSAVSDLKNAVVRVIFHAGKVDSALFRQLEEMAAWAQRRGAPADVCLLGRYNFQEPANFTALADRFKHDLNLSFSTVHRSKGLGFDFVIVLGMSCAPGTDFPSTRQDDPLLSLFMPIADALPFAEERRLFYVAMTRARRACVLMVPKFGASPFVTEVLETRFQESVRSLEISQDEESEVPDPLTTAMQQVCPECRRGRLLPRTGVNGPFMVCERKDRGFSHCRNIQGHVPPGQSTQFRKAPRSPKRAGPG
jgi:DNA helicase-4